MELRETLLHAVEHEELERVEELCRTHRDAIIDSFESWQVVPDDIRTDPSRLERYANGLIAIAKIFAEKLDDDQLLRRLAGGDDNPLARWDQELRKASDEIEDMQYGEAGRRLEKILEDTTELQGSGADQLRPITLGFLGECLFQEGNADASIPFFERALAAAREAGAPTAMAAYLDSLYEVHRYLGRGSAAATYAEHLATVFAMAGRAADASLLKRRAAIARAGEPRNRVVATLEDGRSLELDQIEKVDGSIRFSFQRDRVALRRAAALVEEGERAGASGDYEGALAKFRAAAALDATFPQARYQEGFTLVLLRRYEEAVVAYAATEDLAPGWFHCRADLWLARELAAGRLDHATFEAVRELEDGDGSPEVKLELADRTLAVAPKLAGLHLARGRQLASLGRSEDARAALRDALACDCDPDIRTRTLVQLAILIEDKAERAKLFEEARRLDGNLIAAATARVALVQLGSTA